MVPGEPASPAQAPRWSVDELIPFGKYILLNKISSGATAAVYRAKIRGEAGFERLLTVKRILPQMAGDPDFVETFVREAKICARLNHGNICPIYELGKVGESLYMASEWVSGKDLGAIARRLQYTGRVMPPLVAAFIASRLCDALDYAHGLKDVTGRPIGIVHQDLSPSNTVISYDGQVKLIDFGLARAAGRAQQTNVEALKQKIGYMSPELVLGTALDARSDVFGVGVCLYEMVTGRRLFAGADDIATLKLVSNATVPPPSALIEDTPDEIEMIMMRALERDPDKRWATAGEMGQALAACIAADDPTFGTRDVAEFMGELFANDIAAEQRRLNDLLAASQDAGLMEQRRRFFASPLGAAAIAKAEAARRIKSGRPPPPVSAVTNPSTPPSAAAPADRDTQADPDPVSPVSASMPALHASQTAAADKNAEDTDPDALTTFRPEAKPAAEVNIHEELTRVDLSPPIDHEAATVRPEPAQSPANGAAPHPDEEERTTFLTDSELIDEPATFRPETKATDLALTAPPPGTFEEEPTSYFIPDAQGAYPKLPEGQFEEEATHIFFSQEDGVDLPELPEEAPSAAPPAPLPIPKPASARAISDATARTRKPSDLRTRSLSGSHPADDDAANDPSIALMHAQTSWRGPIALLGLGVGLLLVIALIMKTPLGVALGLREPPPGVIEVRSLPDHASVKLDGVYQGRSPLRLESVRPGVRVIELQADGYLPVTRRVTLEPATTLKAEIDLDPEPKASAAP